MGVIYDNWYYIPLPRSRPFVYSLRGVFDLFQHGCFYPSYFKFGFENKGRAPPYAFGFEWLTPVRHAKSILGAGVSPEALA